MKWHRTVAVIFAPTALAVAAAAGCASLGGSAPTGGSEDKSDEDNARIAAVGKKLAASQATIVWSSSRNGNHDLFTAHADGSGIKSITSGDAVDWFPRFAPDGKSILFVRSKKGWVYERDANADGKWDLFRIPTEGGEATKLVDNASWGTWVDQDHILFVRATKLYKKTLGEDKETLLLDSEAQADQLSGALLQQPEMARDGRFIAITLRGSKRETGIWDLEKKTWTRTGDGCQINWTPDGAAVYWVHPTGNGESRVLRQPVKAGKPQGEGEGDLDKLTFIDLPGRRSHEYFPQLSADGKWLIWAATQRGHDHDIADYEIYIWQVGEPSEQAARLTFHSGNDRWPDIYLAGVGGSSAANTPDDKKPAEAAPSEKVATEEAPALSKAAHKTAKKAAAKRSKGKKKRR
jgi:hypothetical protein